MDKETATVLAAAITAAASLVVALASIVSSRRSTERVARLAAELAEEKSSRDARRDYEYEARKRLYDQCDPLLFQFFELAEDAGRRVKSLARSCRDGNLRPDGSGWLEKQGYYFQSTAYHLLAPIAAIRILQRRLTAVDLALDPRLDIEYRLLRLLSRSFTEDHALARQVPELEYDPDAADEGTADREVLLVRRPAVYVRQGIYRGVLEQVAESLIMRDHDGDRLLSFGEFVEERGREGSRLHRAGSLLRDLLIGFHPTTRPVLWRILVTQFLLYETMKGVRSDQFGIGHLSQLVPEPTPEIVSVLDWRTSAGLSDENEDAATALVVGRQYVTRHTDATSAEVRRYQTTTR
jgi:hypothetical protein